MIAPTMIRFLVPRRVFVGASLTLMACQAPLAFAQPNLNPNIDSRIPTGTVIKPDSDGTVLPDGYSLLYQQDFTGSTALDDFVMTDAKAWRIHSEETDQWITDLPSDPAKALISEPGKRSVNLSPSLEQFQRSNYEPPHRSPFNMALIASKKFNDFVLEVNLLQTSREYGHRDMCLFFGFQDPAHFYYVHIATATDDHAHNIFIVDDAPRIKISGKTTDGIDWGQNLWHQIRLVRKTDDGTIKLFYDKMNTPIMEARDTSFKSGYIGFGTFDDTGRIDNIKIWGRSAKDEPIEFFSGP